MGTVHSPATESLAHRHDRLRRLAGTDLMPLGIAPLLEKPILYTGDPQGLWDWIFMPIEDDPLYQSGELAIPGTIVRKLHRLHATGITFDAYFIGHEIPKDALTTLNNKAVDDVLTHLPSNAHSVLETLTAALAAAPGIAAAAAVDAISDPILIGALTRDATRRPGVAAYYQIARW